jgi:uncharacterized protein (TIGR03435 family)
MAIKSAALTIVVCFALRGQNAPSRVAFDAASIKVLPRSYVPTRGDTMRRGGPGTSDPGRITWKMQTLGQLLATAWGVEEERVVGPSWLGGIFNGGEWYELTATLPPDTSREALQLMLQNLLVERFAAKLHHEARVYPGYTLVVAKDGPKLKPAADPQDAPAGWGPREVEFGTDGFPVIPPGHGRLVAMRRGGVFGTFQGFSIPEFIPQLSNWVRQASGHPRDYIEDKSGLQGKFDFKLKFYVGDPAVAVNVGPQARAATSSASDEAPSGEPSASDSIFKALEKQLGLQLVKSAKGFALDTIVIDHIEKTPIE